MFTEALSFGSRSEFADCLQSHGIVFTPWEERFNKMWHDYKQGELGFFEYHGRLCVYKDKVRLRILAERSEGLRFLQEARKLPGAKDFVPRSESTSVSGKRKLFQRDMHAPFTPEPVYDCLRRELTEELKITDVNVIKFSVRYREKAPEEPVESESCHGLLKYVVKHGLEWVMPRSYQRDVFHEDAKEFGESQFTWVPPCERVLEEYARPRVALPSKREQAA